MHHKKQVGSFFFALLLLGATMSSASAQSGNWTQAELTKCHAENSARQHGDWVRFMASRITATNGVVPDLERRKINAQIDYHAAFRDYTMNECFRSEDARSGKPQRPHKNPPVQPLAYDDPRWNPAVAQPAASPPASPPVTTTTTPQATTVVADKAAADKAAANKAAADKAVPVTTASAPQTTTPAPAAGALSWVAGPAIPPNAVIGGKAHGRDLLICRGTLQDGVHPGKVWEGKCHIAWGGKEVPLNVFEVLVQK